MLISLAYMLLCGLILGWVCEKIKLPRLLGLILTGIILGPHLLNLIDKSILDISAPLRQIALIIILIRAGLTLDLDDLKRAGRPAVLLCFVPAIFEMVGMTILAPILLGVKPIEGLLMGCVVAAVSPAVIVPKCIQMLEEGYGKKKSIPQMILAGASVDDVFVIVMFTSVLSLMNGKNVSVMSFVNIPVSIILGIIIGLVIGVALAYFFRKVHIRDTIKVLIFLSVSFILVTIEDEMTTVITFAALISVMAMGIFYQRKNPESANRLASKFNKLWIVAEIILFVLVGATVDLKVLFGKTGLAAVLLILLVTLFRSIGVYVSLLGTDLNKKERLFVILGYIPKATVQAAIGGLALQAGLPCGELVLTVAIVSILVSAPLGSILMDKTYKHLLTKDPI